MTAEMLGPGCEADMNNLPDKLSSMVVSANPGADIERHNQRGRRHACLYR